MKRRNFVAATALAAASPVLTADASREGADRQYLEMRRWHTLIGSKKGFLEKFLHEAAIPAWNRLGIGPVGVFNVMFGQSSPTLYVLLPHNSLESVVTATRRMLADEEFLGKGSEFLNCAMSDPSYVRYESSLMTAFSHMPKVEVPDAVKNKDSRIFEMRTYESHSEIKAKKKIEMFNEGGEIEIFRQTGLHPVFFGESIIGPQLPNLTYMLAFEDMDARYKNWDVFRNSPAWKELSGKEEYRDTVSNISDLILRPRPCSQI
ncbi:MAG: NIPSNAP family protein [Candidatus Omnitrophica bacterium]|nr:NIPSNAP family protein [Candidatus Omnitrophota bacterium]